MDAWPTFWGWNKPLFERHTADGNRFVQRNGLAHFVDDKGEYAAFPRGYITGPSCSDNDSPRPWYASVYGGESGWVQFLSATREEVVRQARDYAAKMFFDKVTQQIEECPTPDQETSPDEEALFMHWAEIADDAASFLTGEHVLPCDEGNAIAESLATMGMKLRDRIGDSLVTEISDGHAFREIHSLLSNLESLGFDESGEHDVNGADLVDVIAEWYIEARKTFTKPE